MTDVPVMNVGGVAVQEFARGDEYARRWLVFYPPFHCLCCGTEISEGQFRFSALCGRCDLGICQVKAEYMATDASDHLHPDWWEPLPDRGYSASRESLMERRANIWDKFSAAHTVAPPALL